jgi:uncharacterized membrane protein
MKVVNCTNCSEENVDATPESQCRQCGESLALALMQQSLDELKGLKEKLEAARKPTPSFYSFNGIGTMLLDYRALPDGTYEAVRWVTIVFLPVIPLSAYRIQPLEQERSYGRETSKFQVLGKAPLSAARVVRTYGLVFIGLLPIVLGSIYSGEINRAMSGPKAFGLMILAVAWGIYILFFKIPNESKAYQAKAAS